jgi:serine/threonine protein kinase
MESDFFTLVPALVKTAKKGSGVINMAPIAERLVEMTKAIHTTGHLLVDIKPDNFMLAFAKSTTTTTTNKAKSVTPAALAERLRVIDLGLFQVYKCATGHRDNEGSNGKDLVGTPLYASLPVHDGQTNSLRDDVEALLYLIMELVIRTHAAVQGTTHEYETGNKNGMPTYLPWSHEKSDDAIGQCKKSQVQNAKSELYKRMPSEAARILFACMTNIQGCKYKQTPEYDEIMEELAKLTIPPFVAGVDQKKAAKRAAPAAAVAVDKKKAAVAVDKKKAAKRAAPAAAEKAAATVDKKKAAKRAAPVAAATAAVDK